MDVSLYDLNNNLIQGGFLYVPATGVPIFAGFESTVAIGRVNIRSSFSSAIELVDNVTYISPIDPRCANPTDFDWMTPSATEGYIGGNNNTEFSVNFDATNKEPGTYNANICVIPNGSNGEVAIPVTFNVTQAVDSQLNASADTYVQVGPKFQNMGAADVLAVGHAQDKAFVRFDQDELSSLGLSCTPFTAKLRMNLISVQKDQVLNAKRMLVDWAEGNGDGINPGSGNGATWNCAVDSDISNTSTDCTTAWDLFGDSAWAGTSDSLAVSKGQEGYVEFDVTADVLSFLNGTANLGWTIQVGENQSSDILFHSKESGNGPQLIITVQ